MKDSNMHGGIASAIKVPFFSVRNISCPEDKEEDRKVYSGHLPATAVLDLPTDQNVRDYLVAAEGKQRKVMTQVHRAILDTLRTRPQNFSILNGGMVIVARRCVVDEKAKLLELYDASLINGSQTQGVLKDYYASTAEPPDPLHVTFELIVTEDTDLIAEVSIARNFQNDVASISIAGRRGQLQELEDAIKREFPDKKLRQKESQFPGDDYLPTEKLLQVLSVLTPPDLLGKDESDVQVFAYNQKQKCIKEWTRTHEAAHDPSAAGHTAAKALYDFHLDIAPEALRLYLKWKSHPGFKGTGIRAISRNDKGKITDVPDGIVFPILSALAVFAVKPEGQRWQIRPPSSFEDAELIGTAKAAYAEIALHKPHLMGKNRACYTQLRQITNLFKRLAS